MVFVPRNNVSKPAIVVELKWNKSVSAAIEQIKENSMYRALRGIREKLFLLELIMLLVKRIMEGLRSISVELRG